MTPVQRKASLHEKTVQAVARGDVEPVRRRRRYRKPRSSRVIRRKWSDGLDPLLVEWVRREGIDWRRIEVRAADEIIVWNRPRKKF